MRVIIRDSYSDGSIWAAHYIADRIREKAARTDEPFVLGLPTGSTPIGTYDELARMYAAGEISFKNVISFNMVRQRNQTYMTLLFPKNAQSRFGCKCADTLLTNSINMKRFIYKVIRVCRSTNPYQGIVAYHFHLGGWCTRLCRIIIIGLITESFGYC